MNERDLIQKWMAWKEEHEQKPFSQKTLAESAGISPTYLSSILTGIRNAGTKTVERIADAFGVTLAEFYSGPRENRADNSGSSRMQRSPNVVSPVSTAPREKNLVTGDGDTAVRDVNYQDVTGLKLFHTSPDEIERLFDSFGYPLRDDAPASFSPNALTADDDLSENIPESGRYERIPLLSRVPDGNWRELPFTDAEHISSYISSPFSGRRLLGVRITDDSMSPVMERGALALFDPERSSSGLSGEIGVAAHRGVFLVRRVYAVGDLLVLVPANPVWFPEVVLPADTQVFTPIIIPRGMDRV